MLVGILGNDIRNALVILVIHSGVLVSLPIFSDGDSDWRIFSLRMLVSLLMFFDSVDADLRIFTKLKMHCPTAAIIIKKSAIYFKVRVPKIVTVLRAVLKTVPAVARIIKKAMPPQSMLIIGFDVNFSFCSKYSITLL